MAISDVRDCKFYQLPSEKENTADVLLSIIINIIITYA